MIDPYAQNKTISDLVNKFARVRGIEATDPLMEYWFKHMRADDYFTQPADIRLKVHVRAARTWSRKALDDKYQTIFTHMLNAILKPQSEGEGKQRSIA